MEASVFSVTFSSLTEKHWLRGKVFCVPFEAKTLFLLLVAAVMGVLLAVLWDVLKKVCCVAVGLCNLFCLSKNERGMSRERYFRAARCK